MNAIAHVEVERYDFNKEETIIAAMEDAGFGGCYQIAGTIVAGYHNVYLDGIEEFYKMVRRTILGANGALCKIRIRVSLAGSSKRFRLADVDYDRFALGLPG